MYETNVLGVMRMTRALLPRLIDSGDGHVVTIGSIAAWEPYAGGAGYNAAKFGARAVMGALRHEVLGQPVRLTEIDPGMVETEFSTVRFGGDADRAAKVYEGVTPLTADDVAECVTFAVDPTQPRQHRHHDRARPRPGRRPQRPPAPDRAVSDPEATEDARGRSVVAPALDARGRRPVRVLRRVRGRGGPARDRR